jgi:predicted choloylglycine hydrolase
MYVVDYYGAYNIEQIRESGTDPDDIEGSLTRALLPDILLPIAEQISRHRKTRQYSDQPEHSCSTVSFRADTGHVYFGRNFDWKHEPCLIVRVHGEEKMSSVAILDPYYLGLDSDQLADPSIADRLALLFAPYLVTDGMNEYGVAVSSMAARKSRSSYDAEKPTVVKSVLKRLILDHAHTTDQAVELMARYNVDFAGMPCHFMIADASGESVVIEFVDGETATVSSSEHWQVSTNHILTGKSESMRRKICWRYETAAGHLSENNAGIAANDIMEVMSSISMPDWTMWSSVYDLTTGEYRVAYRRQYDYVFRDRLTRRE